MTFWTYNIGYVMAFRCCVQDLGFCSQ